MGSVIAGLDERGHDESAVVHTKSLSKNFELARAQVF